MKLATSTQMQALDQTAIKEIGIPGVVLMENAGLGTVDQMEQIVDLKMEEVRQRLDDHGLKVELSESARKWLAEVGSVLFLTFCRYLSYNRVYG